MNMWRFGEIVHLERAWEPHAHFHLTCPVHLAVPEFCPLIINRSSKWNVFPSSVSSSSKLNTRRWDERG